MTCWLNLEAECVLDVVGYPDGTILDRYHQTGRVRYVLLGIPLPWFPKRWLA